VADDGGRVDVFATATGAKIASLTGQADSMQAVAFSLDGGLLATLAGSDRTVRLWDGHDFAPAGTLPGDGGGAQAVTFGRSEHGCVLAAAGDAVRLWHLRCGGGAAGGRFAATSGDASVLSGASGTVRAVAVSPDGRTLAAAGDDGHDHLWPIGGDGASQTLAGATGATIWGLAFSPDGTMIAT
jgi:WD40 repeat protein